MLVIVFFCGVVRCLVDFVFYDCCRVDFVGCFEIIVFEFVYEIVFRILRICVLLLIRFFGVVRVIFGILVILNVLRIKVFIELKN